MIARLIALIIGFGVAVGLTYAADLAIGMGEMTESLVAVCSAFALTSILTVWLT